MKLSIDFSRLEAALKSIGGTPADLGDIRTSTRNKVPSFEFAPGAVGPTEIIFEATDIGRLHNTSGLLAMDGKQVTLHIFQPTFVDIETLLDLPASGPKVHFTECKTIKEMRAYGKFNKYVTATRTDGLFSVKPRISLNGKQSNDPIEAILLPCKNCLATLNYDGWEVLSDENRQKTVERFSFARLHENFRFIFRCLPLYTTATFPDGNYPPNWARISLSVRQSANWICSCCNVGCADHHDLLHVHHKSGNKGDCKPSNLVVLCAGCHKAQPYHGHMRINPATKNKLEQLRVSQDLPCLCSNCGI